MTKEHDCGRELVPIPYWAAESILRFDPTHPEYALDENGAKCFVIDGCIAAALKAVWEAGYMTTGCCCGHGQASGGIITIDTMQVGTPANTRTAGRYRAIHEAAS